MTLEKDRTSGFRINHQEHMPNKDISIKNPSTNKTIGHVPETPVDDVDRALQSAHESSTQWRQFDPVKRGQILRRISERIMSKVEKIAKLETLETGRPISESRAMVESAARYFEYYAGLTDKIEGKQIPLPKENAYVDYTVREPYGVTAHIIPWNASFVLAARSFAPALATGNTIVAKAPEQAPFSVLELSRIIEEVGVGVPAGTIQTLTGLGSTVGERIISDERVAAIEFTGSTTTGKHVMQQAADTIRPVHLELGGKGANIIFPDADLSAAAESVIETFNNAGQICYAPTRIYIHEGIYDEFLDRIINKVESMTVGPGIEDPDLGPLISPEAQQTIIDYVDESRKNGGRILTGGEIPREEGNFYSPTLIDRVSDQSPISCDELFGPVLTCYEFQDTDEVIRRANDTKYGLTNLVWTNNLSKAHSVAHKLDSGTVKINDYPVLSPAAVSGGYKQSGIGRAKGTQAIEEFTQAKNIIISVDEL